VQREGFVCKRCGECCRHYVLLTDKDIERIRKLGYHEKDFVMLSPFKDAKDKKVIQLIDNKCFFLLEQKNSTICRIYEARPEICADYPFFKKYVDDCRPRTLLPTSQRC